jgi:DNA polymerase elongation subunit (family B)
MIVDDHVVERLGVSHTVTVVRNPHRVGIVPFILTDLRAARKAAKLRMAQAGERGDKKQKANANAQQLAIKVVQNSMYGSYASWCTCISATVTMLGRKSIVDAKQVAEALRWNEPCRVPSDSFEPHPEPEEEGTWLQLSTGEWVRAPVTVVYGDTDSIFFHAGLIQNGLLDKVKREEAVYLMKLVTCRVRDAINAYWKAREPQGVMNITAEKLEHGIIFFPNVKKNYAFLEEEVNEKAGILPLHGKLKVKGLACARRDFPKFIAEIQLKMVEAVLRQRSAQAAYDLGARVVEEVVTGKLPAEAYAISKTIKSKYKTKCPQQFAYLRMLQDGALDAPPIGGRVAYFIAEGPEEKSYQRAVALCAQSSKYRPDRAHYIEILQSQVMKVMEAVGTNNGLAKKMQALFKLHLSKFKKQRKMRQHAGHTPTLAHVWGREERTHFPPSVRTEAPIVAAPVRPKESRETVTKIQAVGLRPWAALSSTLPRLRKLRCIASSEFLEAWSERTDTL